MNLFYQIKKKKEQNSMKISSKKKAIKYIQKSKSRIKNEKNQNENDLQIQYYERVISQKQVFMQFADERKERQKKQNKKPKMMPKINKKQKKEENCNYYYYIINI